MIVLFQFGFAAHVPTCLVDACSAGGNPKTRQPVVSV
jgi:hypothetical protein